MKHVFFVKLFQSFTSYAVCETITDVNLFHIKLLLSKEVKEGTHKSVASRYLCQSHFLHSSLILYPVYILSCFDANLLLCQFMHFFR